MHELLTELVRATPSISPWALGSAPRLLCPEVGRPSLPLPISHLGVTFFLPRSIYFTCYEIAYESSKISKSEHLLLLLYHLMKLTHSHADYRRRTADSILCQCHHLCPQLPHSFLLFIKKKGSLFIISILQTIRWLILSL